MLTVTGNVGTALQSNCLQGFGGRQFLTSLVSTQVPAVMSERAQQLLPWINSTSILFRVPPSDGVRKHQERGLVTVYEILISALRRAYTPIGRTDTTSKLSDSQSSVIYLKHML